MTDARRRSGWIVAAAAALWLGATAPGTAQETASIDETRPVDGDVSVEVETVTRTVRVTGGDRDELRVRGRYYPEHEEFVLEGDRGSMRIELEPRDDHDLPEDLDFGELTVELPRGASLDLQGVNGGMTVRNVDGSVRIESVNGGVTYEGGARSVQAETVNGPVRVDAPRARDVSAGSVSGGVELGVSGGHVSAQTVSGDVAIRASGPVERVRAEAVSGDIEFRGRPASSASLSFQAHSGDVVLHLPSDLAARLEASTFSGEIESAFGGEPRKESRWTPETSFRHAVGSDGARISAETFSGDVRFLRAGG